MGFGPVKPLGPGWRISRTRIMEGMASVAIPGHKPTTPDPNDRIARLNALFAKREATIEAGLETWDYERINADVQERRGTHNRGA